MSVELDVLYLLLYDLLVSSTSKTTNITIVKWSPRSLARSALCDESTQGLGRDGRLKVIDGRVWISTLVWLIKQKPTSEIWTWFIAAVGEMQILVDLFLVYI